MDKVLECAVVSQLLGFLNDVDILDPFHFGFRSGFGIAAGLDDNLRRDLDRRNVSLLVLLNLSVAFSVTLSLA